MQQLSSHLSQPRRRIYGLLTLGLLVALIATALGGLIFGLGRSRAEITLPFWECGEYVLLLGLCNLGIYGAIAWQVNRLSRRQRRQTAAERASIPQVLDKDDTAPFDPSVVVDEAPARETLPATGRRITRQVRGTLSSLNLDP